MIKKEMLKQKNKFKNLPRGFAGLCLAVLSATALLAASAWAQPSSGPINGPQADALIRQLGERLVVVDVRSPEEYAQGHIPQALSIPVNELETRLEEIPPNTPVLFLCHAGRRSTTAFNFFVKSRPEAIFSGIWRLEAITEYNPDGGYSFQKNLP